MRRIGIAGIVACWMALAVGPASAADPADTQPGGKAAHVTMQDPRLYLIATAHLDTQWRWTIRQTIEEYIPATLKQNLDFIEKYPDYVFSFEGAFRYMLAREYYPAEYARVKRAIAKGRWRVAGSWVDAVDVNIPSPESLIRHALYGNGFFRREFGVTSRDVFLPDCFGFGYALPSIAAHCGLTGFSTQKLTWGSAYGVPFNLGVWEGVDGSTLISALNPGEYVGKLTTDLSSDSAVVATVEAQARESGVAAGVRYFGTGDTGGSPTEESVRWMESSVRGKGPVRVLSSGSDQFARDLFRLPAAQKEKLPHYKGELLMTHHGAGCYTAQAAMKRWNRRNEKLAEAAERAAVTMGWAWRGALRPEEAVPRERLQAAYIRFLWHQFHDDLTGTSIPEAYVYSWNDEALAENEFADILASSAARLCPLFDTRTQEGAIPLVVYNPLSIDREDLVQATALFPGGAPKTVRVYNPEGVEVPSQVRSISGNGVALTFLAAVPSCGWAVYEVRPSETPCALETNLSYQENQIENARYRVKIDEDGNIASVFDKRAGREMLSGPIELQLLADSPKNWAAWEVDYDDVTGPVLGFPGRPIRVTVEDAGPAAVALGIERQVQGSTFRQTLRLAAGGAADRLEILNEIDWRTKGTLLKAAFPLAVANETATYDLGLGTIERTTDRKELYEVPAQQWADLTAADGSYGASVLNDCKYGWDKPDDHTLRLTLLHTPEVNEAWQWVKDQASMDLGRHQAGMALVGHAGDWRSGDAVGQADRFNQPLRAFQPAVGRAGAMEGALQRNARRFSFARVTVGGGAAGANTPQAPAQVAIRALKPYEGPEGSDAARPGGSDAARSGAAESAGEIVVRVQELTGSPAADVRVGFAAPVTSAREINGAEETMGEATVRDGVLVTSLRGYQPRSFAVRLAARPAAPRAAGGADAGAGGSTALALPYDVEGITNPGAALLGGFDGRGRSLPGEQVPERFAVAGAEFRTGPRGAGEPNVLACRGQVLELPAVPQGSTPAAHRRLEILAASTAGDRAAVFDAGGRKFPLWIQDWAEPIAQWDSRLGTGTLVEDPARITPAYVKPAPAGFIATHLHTAEGKDEAYAHGTLFRYRIDPPEGARSLTLPDDPAIRILAASSVVSADGPPAVPAQPLIEVPRRSVVRIDAPRTEFLDSARVALSSPTPWARIHYTLDGSEPGPQSALYEGPLTVRRTANLRARAIAPGVDSTYVAVAAFTQLTLEDAVPAAQVGKIEPGLVCRYYEGSWKKLPDFEILTPARTATVPKVERPSFVRAENYGLVLTGYLRVPADGLYTLHLSSDDGSALWIGNRKRIDNDGPHGNTEVGASVALKAGLHPVWIGYFQGAGDAALQLTWEGPGVPLQPVPPEAFSHRGAD